MGFLGSGGSIGSVEPVDVTQRAIVIESRFFVKNNETNRWLAFEVNIENVSDVVTNPIDYNLSDDKKEELYMLLGALRARNRFRRNQASRELEKLSGSGVSEGFDRKAIDLKKRFFVNITGTERWEAFDVSIENVQNVLEHPKEYDLKDDKKEELYMLSGALEGRKKFREKQASQENPEEPEVGD